MDTDVEQARPLQRPCAYILRHPFLYNKFGGWADFYMYGTGPGEGCVLPSLPPSAAVSMHRMKRTRPWYLFPLVINVALIYSSKNLLLTLESGMGDDSEFPLCEWLLYTSMAITSPLFLVMSRLLPDPSMGLCMGGVLSSGGLLWAGMAPPGSLEQKLTYSLGNGMGISLSMQAITLAISPYFVKEGVHTAGSTLFLSLLAMLATHHITGYLAATMGCYGLLLLLGGLVMVTSCLPPAAHLACACADRWGRRRGGASFTRKGLSGDVPLLCTHESHSSKQCDSQDDALLSDHTVGEDEEEENALESKPQGCLHSMGHGLAVIMEDTGWKTSFLSVLVWLTWGAGVDTTWLDIGWTQEMLPYPHRLPSLHLIMGFFLLGVKLAGQHWVLPDSGVRVNLASNYMYLGMLGCSGVLLCLFPECSYPLHGSLLFTASLALQYDDLSDLCLLPGASLCSAFSQYKRGKVRAAFSTLVSSLTQSSRLPSSSLQTAPVVPATSKTTRSSPEPQSFQLSPSPACSSGSRSSKPVSSYALVKCSLLMGSEASQQSGAVKSQSQCLTLVCLLGHSMSLLLMATLSMVLGLQIANLLRQLLTVPPFSFLCSGGGLLVLSSAAIAVSLGKPDVWLGDKRGYTVLS